MRLTVLGSGSAFSGCGCNAGYLVDGRVLVDCGAPVPALVRRAGTSVHDLTLILLTHFHADHSFTLPTVLGARAFADIPNPGSLAIAGPVGTREYMGRLLSDGYGTHIRMQVDSIVAPQYVVLQDGSDVNRRRLSRREPRGAAQHRAVARVPDHRLGGRVVGFSGDSELCGGLRRSIAGCDLYVCECTGWDGPTPGGHLWRDEVAGLIAENPSTRFLLSHLSERRHLPGAMVAHDLLSLEIASAAG